MTNHLIRRIIGALITIIAVTFIAFIALDTTGDPAFAIAGDSASAEQLQALRMQLGLDQPVWARYAMFLANATHGDLGHSLVNNKPVSNILLERLPCTLLLASITIVLATVIGMLIGIAAAVRAGTKIDTLLMSGAAFGLAIPTFWSALLLALIFSVRLRWLPLIGAENFSNLILPSLALALPTAAAIARLMRASLLDVLHADYVRTAHAKGLTPPRVLTHHIVRNSLLPVVTMLGLHFGHLLGGAFIVETIFALPGLGRLTVQAIFDRDYPIVLGATLLVALMYIAINFAVDVAHGWLDPQVAHEAI
jgi:ABC-type dipeptide/oligopeptide/nickel transport system permease component